MTRLFAVLVAALTLVALVGVSGTAASTLPVISEVSYMPKPVYDDQSIIGVTFRASRPARPGYEYGIVLFIGGKYAVLGACTSIAFSWDRKFGGDSLHMRSAGKHSKLIKGTRYGYWCRGSAYLDVVEHKIGSSAIGRPLGTGAHLDFRVAAAP